MAHTDTGTNANASNDENIGGDYVVVDSNDVIASLDTALAMLERIARGGTYTAREYSDNVRAIQQARNDFVTAFGEPFVARPERVARLRVTCAL